MFTKTTVLAVVGLLLISAGLTGVVVLENKKVVNDVVVDITKLYVEEENVNILTDEEVKALEEEVFKEETAKEEVVEDTSEEVQQEKVPVESNQDVVEEIPVVFNNLTRDELVAQINLSLNSTISGKGDVIVDHSLSLGVDPYLATSIILHETGCKWNCSSLVVSCNNVGGQKGGPSCNGGSYKYYETLDEGIRGVISNIYKNYYAYGLTTPETIGPKYAADPTWSEKIWNYMNEVMSK